jgi:hypothetical protein
MNPNCHLIVVQLHDPYRQQTVTKISLHVQLRFQRTKQMTLKKKDKIINQILE